MFTLFWKLAVHAQDTSVSDDRVTNKIKRLFLQMARSTNVIVRQKKSTLKATDLRRVAMLKKGENKFEQQYAILTRVRTRRGR